MVTPRRTARRHSAVGCTPQEPPIGHLGVPGLRTVETSLARVSRKPGVSSQTGRHDQADRHYFEVLVIEDMASRLGYPSR